MKQFLFLLSVIGLTLAVAFFDKKAPIPVGIELHTNPNEIRALEPALNDSLDRVLAFYAQKHQLTFNGPQHIIFSQDTTFIGEKYYALSRPHVSRKNANYFARNNCNADQTISGVITLKVMVLCISPVDTITPAWIYQNTAEIDATLAHEIMHSIQNKLTAETVGGIKGNRPAGPIWMAEGTANYMARDFQGAMVQKRMEFERVFARAQGADKSIDALQHSPPFGDFEYYGVSHLAAFLLIERFGVPAMFQYWENIGQGYNWNNSFSRAFLMPMSDFEQQFDTLRRDRNAAWDWMTAEKSDT